MGGSNRAVSDKRDKRSRLSLQRYTSKGRNLIRTRPNALVGITKVFNPLKTDRQPIGSTVPLTILGEVDRLQI